MSYSTRLTDGVWNEDMGCNVCSLAINMEAKVVTFWPAYMNVADKRGAINTARKHLPDVRIIQLIAPERQAYQWNFEGGEWVKYECP